MESLQAVIACMINSPAPVVGGDRATPRKPAAPTHVRRSSNAGASPLGMAGLNLDSADGSPSPPSSVVSDESHAEVSGTRHHRLGAVAVMFDVRCSTA